MEFVFLFVFRDKKKTKKKIVYKHNFIIFFIQFKNILFKVDFLKIILYNI